MSMGLDEIRGVDQLPEDRIDQLIEMARSDWHAARETRKEREDRAVSDYELYRRREREGRRVMMLAQSWSKIEVPLAFWLVETELARIGTQPPTVSVTARTAEAVPYAFAKRLRIQYHLQHSDWEINAQDIIKSMLVLGDGVAKVPWNGDIQRPQLLYLDWFDFFLSHECTRYERAEVQFHRSYWTPRMLAYLDQATDGDGNKLWFNLDYALGKGGGRDTQDDTWSRRRQAAGLGDPTQDITGPETQIVECWYRTGEYIVLGGAGGEVLIRAGMSPFKDSAGRYIRPFVMFQNTSDMVGPYSIGECETLEDHQIELSTVRNQWIDQITRNIDSGIIYDERISHMDVDDFMSAPGGRLAVPGNPSQLVHRFEPGFVSSDFPVVYEQIRNESQLISGVSDEQAGVADPSQSETATEFSIRNQISNRRFMFKQRRAEIAMGKVCRLIDCHDQQFCGSIRMPEDKGVPPPSGSKGYSQVGGDPNSGFVDLSGEVNAPGMEYEIEVDAGSTARPNENEEAQRFMAFIAACSHPMIEPLVDWQEVARRLVQVNGMSEDRMLKSQEELTRDAAMAAAQTQAGPGAVPASPPIPVETPTANGGDPGATPNLASS